jgi:peptide/nickel transport system substrate-binding protein
MHLGSADRRRRRAIAPQSAQIVVEQYRGNRRRPPNRSHLCLEAAAAGDPRPDRLRLYTDLSLPCLAARYAAASDRHRPVQIRRFKPNEGIKLVRNPDYWKSGSPYLDGIEYTIIPNRSTAILAFVAGKFDLTFPYEVTVPLLKNVKQQAPQAVCDLTSTNASTNLLVNREAPPFDNPDLRRALALALDRKSFIDILSEGHGDIGGAMQPPPAGVWGMPADILATIPGYAPDLAKNRAGAREIMQRLGYGPDKRLAIKVAARNIPAYRDPAVILIDQLKEIWIDGELDAVETANWFPKLARKDYQIGLNNTGSGVDDPDQQFFENYGCGSERNYTGYCNPELEKLFIVQSTMADREKRRRLVWEIDKKLQEDGARPIIYHTRAATCMQPQVNGLTVMVQQPIQWLAHGRRVARPVSGP